MKDGCVYEIYFHFITPTILEFYVHDYEHDNVGVIKKVGEILKNSFGDGRNKTVASKVNPKHYDKRTYKIKVDICKETVVA